MSGVCALLGIATEYQDIWGAQHAVSEASLRALIDEFGLDTDAASPELLLDGMRHRNWHHVLPPVMAIAEGDAAWFVTLRLPAGQTQLRWRIDEEQGGQHSGEVSTQQLDRTDEVDLDGVAQRAYRLALNLSLPAGYHRLVIEGAEVEAAISEAFRSTLLIAAPEHCFKPDALAHGGRIWGPAIQLYSLRSKRNWGIGDFSDLAQVTEPLAAQGASIIGLNPLHALFAHNPAHASPYSPSSRLQLNVLYIDVEAVDGFRDCEAARDRVQSPEFQSRLAKLRETELIDHVGVAAAKFEVLELLFAHFRSHHLADSGRPSKGRQSPLGRSFRDFVAERGETLKRHALFEALQAHFHAADASVWGWPVWPEAYRDHNASAVAQFADEQEERVQFHQFLQWQAARQLGRVSDRCRALGLAVGLYLDLAVSVDRAGSDVWGHREAFAPGASVGAPPDEFNPAGQNWGLPPLRPDGLRESRYAFFIETMRACMRSSGAVRIDHVMGLMRLFCIPPQGSPPDGTYIHYALDEMLAIVALESVRNRCMVIGEDLGTVAEAMRVALGRFDVLSYRLLYFERNETGGFVPPQAYPRGALVAVSTHDLATLAGWWAGHDLRLRLQLGLFPDPAIFEKQLLDRAQERVRLLLAVQTAGLLTPDAVAEASGATTLAPAVAQAIHAFVASTPSSVMLVQLEDVIGVVDQVNMPGTTEAQPNWRRKLPLDLQAIVADPRMLQMTAMLSALRPQALPDASIAQTVHAMIPRATYRLQFHKDFGFDDAVKVLPYLARLGVSHIYCSPIQRARPGSMHGYDVVAHDEINPELGGPEGFERFCAALREHGMGQMLDMVPNHMGVLGADNAWWMDVLENGPASLYAQHFDIDWQPLNPELTGKVLVPVLGDHYGDILERGELVLVFEAEAGTLALRYFDNRFPLAPRTYPTVLALASARLADLDLAASLDSIATAFGHLPARELVDEEARLERARDKEVLKGRLARLGIRQPLVADAVVAAVAELNQAAARDQLHALIEAQAYRLAYWRVAADEINYRRFFDINELAALRMERREVFEATQGFALDLAAAGVVDGLRIDHPDGMYDPARYFEELQEGYARRAGFVLPAPGKDGRPSRPLYVVAEKIAAPHEEVPVDWQIHGTTGYRFTNVANAVLVDSSAARRFDRIWRSFTGVEEDFETLARIGKRDIIRSALASELNVLATELMRIARADRRTRDYTLNALRRAIAEVAACMPVYRTYIIDAPSAQDRRYIEGTVDEAMRQSDAADTSIFGFVRNTLLAQAVPGASDALREQARRFAVRFQQFSAPVAAKGVEDTAFYRYFPLSSLNEVGGEPAHFGMTVPAFHAASADRAARWPHTMLATSTHDNKRSEDVRNRIDVLSEMPGTWRLALRRWRRLNAHALGKVEESRAPSASDEYLLYQTLLGTLPPGGLDAGCLDAYADRIVTYMLKAAREAKVHTRWTNPHADYEAALEGFIRAILARVDGNAFLADLQALGDTMAWYGALNSLSLVLLKYGSPGVPDLYQGNELMDLSLVDPDNRRPVDYEKRARWLGDLDARAQQGEPAEFVRQLAAAPHDGHAKLWLTRRLLALRAEQPMLFSLGGYSALQARGDQAAHVIAFARKQENTSLVVIAGRLFHGLDVANGISGSGPTRPLPLGAEAWGQTFVAMPGWADGTRFRNVLTDELLTIHHGSVRMADAFARFPAAAIVPV